MNLDSTSDNKLYVPAYWLILLPANARELLNCLYMCTGGTGACPTAYGVDGTEMTASRWWVTGTISDGDYGRPPTCPTVPNGSTSDRIVGGFAVRFQMSDNRGSDKDPALQLASMPR